MSDFFPFVPVALPQLSTTCPGESVEMPNVSPGHTEGSPNAGETWSGSESQPCGMENVRRGFGLPDSYDVLAVVPLGYPKRKIIGKKRRKPIGEVVSAERFGTPFA